MKVLISGDGKSLLYVIQTRNVKTLDVRHEPMNSLCGALLRYPTSPLCRSLRKASCSKNTLLLLSMQFIDTQLYASNKIVCHVPLFSIPSGTEWQQGDSRDKDLVTMMQIDCQVMDTKFVNIKKSSIPVPSSDSPYFSTPASVSVPQDYSAPAGNTFVKPAK